MIKRIILYTQYARGIRNNAYFHQETTFNCNEDIDMPIFTELNKKGGILPGIFIMEYRRFGNKNIEDILNDYEKNNKKSMIYDFIYKIKLYMQSVRLMDSRASYYRGKCIYFCTEEYLQKNNIVPIQNEDTHWKFPVLDKISFEGDICSSKDIYGLAGEFVEEKL